MKNDNDFVEALNASSKYVAAVASWMMSKNCDVMIRPTLIRPSFEARNEFADSGDIEIRQRIEVKHRDLDFTCASDYPFATVIVDEQFKIDRIPKGRLWGYMVVNRNCTHVCCIRPDAKSKWILSTRFDKKDGQDRKFYECPKELCVFVKIAAKDAA